MNFKNKFNREDFITFFRDKFLPDDFSPENENILLDFTPNHIQKVTLIGNVGSLDLKIYEVKHSSENDPRVSLSKDIFRVMRDYSVRNALILFASDNSENYRFSLATISFSLDDKKVKKEYSNPRRYSFFLGPDSKTHTPEEFLIKKGKVKDFKDLLGRFSVEVVSKTFFSEYLEVFGSILKYINDQKLASYKECYDFTLQLLNRTLFIYFVQKKLWLGNNPYFVESFWNEYKSSGKKDEFYYSWLSILFFFAFNNKNSVRRYFSKGINDILMTAPYLNGGLFRENELDKFEFDIPDKLFTKLFEFLNKYNFTINESSPVDVDLEVDPKFIGDVYESLVNVKEEKEGEFSGGIFYTDRNEIDLMCKLSLIEYFSNHLGNKQFWISYFFSDDSEKQNLIDNLENKILKELKYKIEALTIIDPACGSGSFLVYMMMILSELYKQVCNALKINMNEYEIKKLIISKCLYGVDVKKWAVQIAELRLWLQLVLDADLPLGERRITSLLPNLDLNIRCGDSLVQELAGINLSLKSFNKKSLKNKIDKLKDEKYKYIVGAEDRKFKTEKDIKKEEVKLFKGIIDERIEELKELVRKKSIKSEVVTEIDITGKEIVRNEKSLFYETNKTFIENLKLEIQELESVKKRIANLELKPFVWDLDFVEIFSDEDKQGFDIVIGNPPYLRGEKISDPNIPIEEITTENKKEYKAKLLSSVMALFPSLQKLSMKSDLYIYFYFHGLALLNRNGTFCFITSNAWLDVEYGKELQEFLLKNVKIIGIYDNQAERSFSNADINTVITLFSSPKAYSRKDCLNNIVKFVMFKKPFAEIKSEDVFCKILDDSSNSKEKIVKSEEYRIYQTTQKELLEEGSESDDDERKLLKSGGAYVGDKWGGKYLRAPDIFYRILKMDGNEIVKLGSISKIKFGIKTGVNEFFYLDDIAINKWNIEKEFLKKVFRSPRECKKISIDENELHLKIFICDKSKKELKGSNALKYINWGEKNEFDKVRSVQSRQFWWNCPNFTSKIFMQMSFNDGFKFWYSVNELRCDARLYTIDLNDIESVYLLNSTITFLFIELYGRTNLGEGALDFKVYEAKEIRIVNKDLVDIKKLKSIKNFLNREIKSVFEECGINPNIDIRSQDPNPLPDRKQLDDIVFDAIGLTPEERKEVYWSVCELVWNRLNKARSV